MISDVATLKAVAEPQRLNVLLALCDQPLTVKEVAASMGVPATRLYYHVRILERHGLVRVVRRRVVSGIEERTYEATARNWTLADHLWTSEQFRTVGIKAMHDMAAAELRLALEAPTAAVGAPADAVLQIVFTRLYLTPQQCEDVQKRLGAIMDEFGLQRPTDEHAEYHALFTVYRRP